MNYDELEAGREMDASVVKTVFGVQLLPKEAFDSTRCLYSAEAFYRDAATGEVYCVDEHIDFSDEFEEITDAEFFSRFPNTPNQSKKIRVPHYSSNRDAAWQVVEYLRSDGYHFTCNDRGGDPWWAEFANDDYSVGGQASGDALEVVICRAGLNLMADIARIKATDSTRP